MMHAVQKMEAVALSTRALLVLGALALSLALPARPARADGAPAAGSSAPAATAPTPSYDAPPPAEADPHAGHNHAPGEGHGAHGAPGGSHGAAPKGPAEPLADLAGKVDLSPLRDLAVQDGGRRKPLDSFAREKVKLIFGADRYQGQDPVYTLMSLFFETDRWESVAAVAVKHQKLVELLGKRDLSKSENTALVSFAELNASAAFDKELRAIDPDDKMTGPFANAVQELHHRRLYFYNLARTLRVAPVPGTDEKAAWSSVLDLEGQPAEVRASIGGRWQAAAIAWRAGDAQAASVALGAFASELHEVQGAKAPAHWKLAMERMINVVRPLVVSYFVLIIGAALLGVSLMTGGRASYLAGMVIVGGGTALSVAALVARTVIVERAPVSNLYEAASFAVVASLLVGLVFEVAYRNGIFATSAALFAALGSLLIDLAGMDVMITPLVPVLRSYWLNIHVTCMLLSYSTFAIAFMLGVAYFAKWFPAKGMHWSTIAFPVAFAAAGVGLLFYRNYTHTMPSLWDYGTALVFAPGLGIALTAGWIALRPTTKIPYEKELELKTLERYLDRVSMVGLLIITAGILLGAVWANESWGRYWGWDPKETWAFITWMVYAVYVHGRIGGWFRGAMAAIFPIVGFYSVLFTFFGVSFVLPGLHSYLKS